MGLKSVRNKIARCGKRAMLGPSHPACGPWRVVRPECPQFYGGRGPGAPHAYAGPRPTLPDFWGLTVRFESDQKSDTPKRGEG